MYVIPPFSGLLQVTEKFKKREGEEGKKEMETISEMSCSQEGIDCGVNRESEGKRQNADEEREECWTLLGALKLLLSSLSRLA